MFTHANDFETFFNWSCHRSLATYISCQNRSEYIEQVTFDIQMTLENFAREKPKTVVLSLKMLIYGFSVSYVVWNVHLLKIFWCFQEHQTTNVQSLEWCLFKCSCPDLNAFLFNSNSFTSYMSILYILAHRCLSGYISQNIFLQKFYT